MGLLVLGIVTVQMVGCVMRMRLIAARMVMPVMVLSPITVEMFVAVVTFAMMNVFRRMAVGRDGGMRGWEHRGGRVDARSAHCG